MFMNPWDHVTELEYTKFRYLQPYFFLLKVIGKTIDPESPETFRLAAFREFSFFGVLNEQTRNQSPLIGPTFENILSKLFFGVYDVFEIE
jgi:hypothetical protein